MNAKLARNEGYTFLEGGGEMGKIISAFNWSQTSLGAIPAWPASLRITLGNILHSAFPMFLFWGHELLCFYNDAFRPSLGINGKHPAIGKKGQEVWSEIWDFIGPIINKVVTTGNAVFFEDQLVPFYRNGKVEDIYWTFSYSPSFGNNDDICGVLVTCMETTAAVFSKRKIEEVVAQRTAELATAHRSLLRSNVYLQQIINIFKEPLQVLEPVFENGGIIDFRFKLTNKAYAAYANTTPEMLVNKRVGDVFPGYFQTSSFTKVAETFVTGVSDTWELHYNMDGLDLYNQMSATRLGDEVLVHFTDFSRLKRTEMELLRKIEELERSNRNLEEFAHAASHDLKEPIRKIQVFTNILKDQLKERLRENEEETFKKIDNATKRMRLLVDDLLLYSHVSFQPVEKEEIDLNQKLQRVLDDLELDINEKQAIIQVHHLPTIKGYRRQLQQMFQNLISNALKYSKTDEQVHITITSRQVKENDRTYHLIQVQDNGIGFEQAQAEKIFGMFVRLHEKHTYAGTGVGLSIVRKVVENHNGFIKAEGEVGKGATFKVYLPVTG